MFKQNKLYIHQVLFLIALIFCITLLIGSKFRIFSNLYEDYKLYIELEQLEAIEHQYE